MLSKLDALLHFPPHLHWLKVVPPPLLLPSYTLAHRLPAWWGTQQRRLQQRRRLPPPPPPLLLPLQLRALATWR